MLFDVALKARRRSGRAWARWLQLHVCSIFFAAADFHSARTRRWTRDVSKHFYSHLHNTTQRYLADSFFDILPALTTNIASDCTDRGRSATVLPDRITGRGEGTWMARESWSLPLRRHRCIWNRSNGRSPTGLRSFRNLPIQRPGDKKEKHFVWSQRMEILEVIGRLLGAP